MRAKEQGHPPLHREGENAVICSVSSYKGILTLHFVPLRMTRFQRIFVPVIQSDIVANPQHSQKRFACKAFLRKGAAGVSGKVFGAAKYLQKALCRDVS